MDEPSTGHTLGAYLRAARTAAGLTGHELARLAGINQSYLVKLENDQNVNPSAEKLQRLAEALDIDLAELLTFVGVKPSSVLPPADIYFRKRYGMSEADARAAAELIEERYGSQAKDKQVKTKKEVDNDQPDR
jgi:transcriptional regulator with XRE-family HTH domain